jgi:hypothetical protein
MYFRETGFEDWKWMELAQYHVAFIDIEPPGPAIHCLSSSSEFTTCLYNEWYIQLMAQHDQAWHVTALRSAFYIYTTLEVGLSADSGAPSPSP